MLGFDPGDPGANPGGATRRHRVTGGSMDRALPSEGRDCGFDSRPVDQHGYVTQWQSIRLLIGWLQVRVLPCPPGEDNARAWCNGSMADSKPGGEGSNPSARANKGENTPPSSSGRIPGPHPGDVGSSPAGGATCRCPHGVRAAYRSFMPGIPVALRIRLRALRAA